MVKLLAFVLPLGLDSFAIAAALGVQRPTAAQRLRLSALFVLFEAGMLLVELALGALLARLVGSAAEYMAAAILAAAGAWMLFSGEEAEEQAAGQMLSCDCACYNAEHNPGVRPARVLTRCLRTPGEQVRVAMGRGWPLPPSGRGQASESVLAAGRRGSPRQ